MPDIKCKKCASERFVKSGHIDGHQRYKCKDCGMQFTQRARRGVDPVAKGLAVFLYSYCGLSMSKIAKLFSVSVVAVLKWIRKAALDLPSHKTDFKSAQIIMLDEIWHFVGGKKRKYGSGEPLTGYHVVLSDGKSALVVIPL